MLFGCTQAPSDPGVPAQLVSDVNLIASGMSSALASLALTPGVSAAAIAQMQFDIAIIQTDARQLAAAQTVTPATTTSIQTIAQLVQSVASIALPMLPMLPGGSAIAPVIQAAISLLPIILAVVGVAGAGIPATYSPDAARLILISAKK